MSREIKFRQFINEKMSYSGFEGCGSFINPNVNIDIYPLMQYTGLKDKNGVQIYEGDIIRVGLIESEEFDGAYRSVHLVKWCSSDDYPAFDLIPSWDDQLNSFSSILNTNCFEMEVIGNIYENPELLEDINEQGND